MKKLILVIVLIIVAIAVFYRPNPPHFERVEDLQSEKISSDEIRIKGKMIFNNPNILSCTVTKTDLKYTHKGIDLGESNLESEQAVNAYSEFFVPVTLIINPKQFISQGASSLGLGGLLNLLQINTIDITVKGTISVKFLGFSIPIPVETTQPVPLSKELKQMMLN